MLDKKAVVSIVACDDNFFFLKKYGFIFYIGEEYCTLRKPKLTSEQNNEV